MSNTNKFGQKFYRKDADRAFPEGCKCGNNGGGDCDWCQVYYGEISVIKPGSMAAQLFPGKKYFKIDFPQEVRK